MAGSGMEERALFLRLFGLRRPRMNRIEEETFPCPPGLTVAGLWQELRRDAEPRSALVDLQPEAILALVNGVPVQRLAGWDTPLAPGDTVTLMVKAFGG